MEEIRRKPVPAYWRDSSTPPLRINNRLDYDVLRSVNSGMPVEKPSAGHHWFQGGLHQQQSLNANEVHPIFRQNWQAAGNADDDEMNMRPTRPYSPLDEGFRGSNMDPQPSSGTWVYPLNQTYDTTPGPVLHVGSYTSDMSANDFRNESGRMAGRDTEEARVYAESIAESVITPPKPPPAASSPPDGGLAAWLQVAGAFFLFFNSWGLVNTYGVFQDYYQRTFLNSFAPSSISWIGTVQGFLLIFVGILSGPLYDLGYLRGLIGFGTGLIVMGLLVAGEVREYFGIFLSLGLLVGLGAGCLFVPSVAIVAQYFTTKRPLATGIAAAGGSFGGVIFPIVFKEAIDGVGYGWACRILALIVLSTLAWPFFIMKARMMPAKKRALLELSAFKDPTFTLFSVALFFTFIGLYVPFFYVPAYARMKLEVDGSLPFYLLSILNAGSFFGRIIPNLVAVYAGALNILLFCIFTSGILVFFWIPVENLAGLIAFCILYGFFSGAVVSLPPSALTLIVPDLSKIGTRLGMSFSVAGFGLLVGNPIAGALLRSEYQFVGVQVYSGIVIQIGFVLLGAALLVFNARKMKNGGEK